MNETDEALVRQAQLEVPGALNRLCDAWLPVVLGWTRRLGGPRVDCEDAAHDVFIVVFRRLGDLDRVSSFPSWLFAITRRVVAAHRRRAWVRRWLPGATPDAADDRPDPLRVSEQSEVARRVWEALERLPAAHREILVLCDLEERADSEVVEMLGIPKGTVKSRLRRARLALRQHVGDLVSIELPDLATAGGAT